MLEVKDVSLLSYIIFFGVIFLFFVFPRTNIFKKIVKKHNDKVFKKDTSIWDDYFTNDERASELVRSIVDYILKHNVKEIIIKQHCIEVNDMKFVFLNCGMDNLNEAGCMVLTSHILKDRRLSNIQKNVSRRLNIDEEPKNINDLFEEVIGEEEDFNAYVINFNELEKNNEEEIIR